LSGPRCVLITGASGGIGGALADAYARPGAKLILHGRNPERLAAAAERCRRAGAEAHTKSLDLRQLDALLAWLEAIAPEVDLAIVNAGVTSSVRAVEGWSETHEVLDVNVRAALACAVALVPAMRRRGRGQIALMSSIAAWHGLPATPAYSASKAALKAYGEALRGWLAPQGVKVNVVLAGFVRTAMSERFPGPKRFMLSPQDAAARIVRGLARDQARISFPWLPAAAMRSLALLPAPISLRILRALGYGG
jgi:short-subunit dehydrogenase